MARKPKRYILTKAVPAVFTRPDGTDAVFQEHEVGLDYFDDDPAVARAVEIYPDNFTAL